MTDAMISVIGDVPVNSETWVPCFSKKYEIQKKINDPENSEKIAPNIFNFVQSYIPKWHLWCSGPRKEKTSEQLKGIVCRKQKISYQRYP